MAACDTLFVAFAILVTFVCQASGEADVPCEVRARTEYGWVCGRRVTTFQEGSLHEYATFRGVPYAKQPVGELRFKELQPPEPWHVPKDTTTEGPVCPQYDTFYGRAMQPQGMSEACIHANIHVPIQFLPDANLTSENKHFHTQDNLEKKGLPVLVVYHGGAFAFGSGDSDVYGPEHLIAKEIIVITFNYRINVFGFLSLNHSSIPGNNGLRDGVTFLRWVKRNAHYFGGNPDDVTLLGHSSGAASAHLLTLSPAAEGLFNKAILMSGTAYKSLLTTSPVYAQTLAQQFLAEVGINATDPEIIHQQLIEMPIEDIMAANRRIQEQQGVIAFTPVVESAFEGVTQILDDHPEVLIEVEQRGKNIPLVLGWTSDECEVFRHIFVELNWVERVKENPLILLAPDLVYTNPQDKVLSLAEKVEERYFPTGINMEGIIETYSDTYFGYPAIKLSETRSKTGAASYLYFFDYRGGYNPWREVLGLSHGPPFHMEDLAYLFKMNSMNGSPNSYKETTTDQLMKVWLAQIVENFMKCFEPSCPQPHVTPGWPEVNYKDIRYQLIDFPKVYNYVEPTDEQKGMVAFHDTLHN